MTARSPSAIRTKHASSMSSRRRVTSEYDSSAHAKRHLTKDDSTMRKKEDTVDEDTPEVELTSGRFVYVGRGPQARRVSEVMRHLRKTIGRTQQELADAVGIAQSELSRMEQRQDLLLSTLRRYVEGLGASLEICAVFEGKRVRIL